MVTFLPVSLFDLLVVFLVKRCIFISMANVRFRIKVTQKNLRNCSLLMAGLGRFKPFTDLKLMAAIGTLKTDIYS